MIEVPEVVRNKAVSAGADEWLDDLPSIVERIESDWSIIVGKPYVGATEAFVARARRSDGLPAVLKLMIPRPGNHAENEITFLRLANGEGCVRLLRDDASRGALLLERLGRSLHDAGGSIERRHEILCAAAMRVWRPADGCGLPTGAEKARWLRSFIRKKWEQLDHPCTKGAVEVALSCAKRREAAHDDGRSVLVHGDVHQWNALETGRSTKGQEGPRSVETGDFKLIDPDGLLAEPEYDMGILMREDPADLLEGDTTTLAHERARALGARTGLDADVIWQWGNIERVSTGLLLTEIDLQPTGREMLEVSDRIASDLPRIAHRPPA